jgi:phospholipid transport system substrate-binding protein
MNSRWLRWFGMGVWLLSLGAQAAIDNKNPQQMVVGLSVVVLEELKNRAAELENNPGEIRQFAEKNILPYVDTQRMARHVAGRFWREATAAQQQAFAEQFTLTIMRSYSQSLLKLSIERIDVADPLPDGDNRVIVPTRVLQGSGRSADVAYRVFQEAQTKNWLVYDVIVEGISLLVNFRQSYTADIERNGFDQVIASMKERNQAFQ